MEAALAKVRSAFGREYELHIGGEWIATGDKLVSVNPSNPQEIVGIHHKATAELADRAVEDGVPISSREWSRTPAGGARPACCCDAARILRERKLEFDAWLVYEAGKTWPEAEADVAEAIDFCEYYAREMLRLARPQPVVQLPGEQDEMIYLPLGVGRGHSALEFPAGDPGRHDGGGAGDRATPSSSSRRARRRPSPRSSPRCCARPDSRRAASRC